MTAVPAEVLVAHSSGRDTFTVKANGKTARYAVVIYAHSRFCARDVPIRLNDELRVLEVRSTGAIVVRGPCGCTHVIRRVG